MPCLYVLKIFTMTFCYDIIFLLSCQTVFSFWAVAFFSDRYGGLLVSTPYSGLSGPGSSAKTLYSCAASLHPGGVNGANELLLKRNL